MSSQHPQVFSALHVDIYATCSLRGLTHSTMGWNSLWRGILKNPIFLEGHKNLKEYRTLFWRYGLISKNVGDFFFTFCGLLTMSLLLLFSRYFFHVHIKNVISWKCRSRKYNWKIIFLNKFQPIVTLTKCTLGYLYWLFVTFSWTEMGLNYGYVLFCLRLII